MGIVKNFPGHSLGGSTDHATLCAILVEGCALPPDLRVVVRTFFTFWPTSVVVRGRVSVLSSEAFQILPACFKNRRDLWPRRKTVMASCSTARCTRCGRKKKQDVRIYFIDDNEFGEEEMLDGIWSPLEPLRGKDNFSQRPSYSPDRKGRIIILDLATDESEQSSSASCNWRTKTSTQTTTRRRHIAGKRNFDLKHFMHSVAHGLASAFRTTATRRHGKVGRHVHGDDFELHDLRGPHSLRPSILPSRARLRYLFDRMQAKPQPLSAEQRPLAAGFDDNASPYPSHAPDNTQLWVL